MALSRMDVHTKQLCLDPPCLWLLHAELHLLLSAALVLLGRVLSEEAASQVPERTPLKKRQLMVRTHPIQAKI